MTRKTNFENTSKRKEQIVKAAIAVFARKGMKEASMNDIVRESGLSKGAIYWYYNSKDEIISDLLEEFFNPNEVQRFKDILSRGTVSERLSKFTDYVVSEMDKMRKYRSVLHELYVIAMRNRKVKNLAGRDFKAGTEAVQRIIENGIASKEFRPVDPHEVTLAIYEIIEGAALLWALGLAGSDLERHLRNGINLILDGIKTPKE